MNDLEKKIKEIDIDNMRDQISSLYNQMKHSIDIMKDFTKSNSSYKNIADRYDKILIIGMGGSAIGADFARTIIEENLSVPIVVVRDYTIPNWVDEKTFVIASSYSGNTEETLVAYKECLRRKCDSIVISTGGELSRIAVSNDIGLIKLPTGYQPRAAIGYSLSILLLIFVELGVADKKILNNLKESIRNKLGSKYNDQAQLIATKLFDTFPVIYSGAGYMEILSIRLKGQLAENAKILSYHGTFPEHNHNEIEGWSANSKDLTSKFSVIWMTSSDRPHVKKRMTIVKDIISKYPFQQIDINVYGETVLEKVFTMIHIIDWISFYLAILYENNPSPVDNIQKLKTLMVE